MKNSQSYLHKSRRVMLLCAFLLFLTFCFFASTRPSSSQDADKLIKKDEFPKAPVKIALVKSKIGELATDKKISAGDDWLKGLTIRVRNDSENPSTASALISNSRSRNISLGNSTFSPPLSTGETPSGHLNMSFCPRGN